MKRKLIILLITICSFFIIDNIYALQSVRVTSSMGTNVMNEPSTNSSVLGTLKYNDNITLQSTNIIKSIEGCPSGWYKADYNGKIGYVCSNFTYNSKLTIKINSSTGVNARYGAGTNNKIYKNIANNTLVTLVSSTKYSGTGCSKGWYKIRYDDDNLYICSTYTKGYNSNSNLFITSTTGGLKNSAGATSYYKSLVYNQSLTLYDTTLYKSSNCSSGNYKVYYNGMIKYICKAKVLNTSYNGTINNIGDVSLRAKATSSSTKVTGLKYGTNVSLYNTTKYKGSGCKSGWYKVKYNGYTRYICSKYVSTSNITSTVQNTSSVNIRSGAGTNYSKITSLKQNQIIILQSNTTYKGTGCTSGWYKIFLNAGTGYICSTYTGLYVKLNTENSTNNKTSENTTASDSNPTPATKQTITTKSSTSGNYYLINNWNYRVAENYVYVRSSASTSSTLKDTLYLGTELEVLGTSASSSGCSAGWYKVKYYNGKTGYICKSLVDKYSDITKTDNTYCETLKNKGFPASYCPYLSYLHSKYPNWNFTPEKTGITFLAAINGETGKNYTQNTYSDYLKSTTIAEAGGWRVANAAYTAFMLDPRNYLNERNIFAFEQLSYDKVNHTSNVVKSIFDGTWLDNDTYANYYINAGTLYNISPVHLASRTKQEGGTSKTYDAVSGNVSTKWSAASNVYVCSSYGSVSGSNFVVKSGTNLNVRKGPGTNYAKATYGNSNYVTATSNDTLSLVKTTKFNDEKGCSAGWYKVNVKKSLKGIYNFYNIGAYGDNPVIRGLAAAAGYVDELDGTPWNSQKTAIEYGAKFIANGYINKGQDTMYYQKFNTGPNNYYNKYTHQYMTNILAPASESLSAYSTYNNLKIINKAYVFKIPVYNSMPTESTTHPQVK